MIDPSIKLGDGDWAVKENKLLGYRPLVTKFEPIEFDVTRNTIATEVDKDGIVRVVQPNVARIDYSEDGEGKLLLEPQRTNIYSYSSNVQNPNVRNQVGGTGAPPLVDLDYSISPDGTQNADRVQFNLGGGTTISDYSWLVDVSAPDTNGFISMYLKTNDNSSKVIYFRNTFGTIDNITVDGNWKRYDIQNNTTRGFYLGLRGGFGNSDTADISVWGIQLEEGSYPTSYIPTNGSPVTRNADIVDKIGLDNYINSSEGVLYFEGNFISENHGGINQQVSLSDGTGNTLIAFYAVNSTATSILAYAVIGGTFMFPNTPVTVPSIAENFKLAIRYKAGDNAVFVNGVKVATRSTVFTPTPFNRLGLCQFNGASVPFAGKVKNLQVLTALTDAELITLTSPVNNQFPYTFPFQLS